MKIKTRSEKMYSWLLFLYPKKYRIEYGVLMLQIFRDIQREIEQRRDEENKVLALWSWLLGDLCISLVQQYWEVIKKFNVTIHMEKLFTPIRLISLIGIFTFSVFIIREIYFKPYPQLIPLNDPHATYTIATTHTGECCVIHYATTDRSKSMLGNFAEIFIVKSDIDLSKYVGKNVLLTGEFISGDQSCIANTCGKKFGPFIGLEITSIQEKK